MKVFMYQLFPAMVALTPAGIKKGDIITKVNNTPVTSGIEMSAQIAGFRPNDKVQMSICVAVKNTNTTVT
jgi:S1-C subfamily serine protease